MSARPRLLVGIGTVAVLSVTAACGGDGDAAPPTTATTRTSAGASTTAPPAASATTTTAAPAVTPIGEIPVSLTHVADVDRPTALATRGGDGRLYVTEQVGRVRAVPPEGGQATTVVDLSGEISSDGERGLLGIAFAPDGGHVYLHFTNRDGDTRLVELGVRGDGSFDVGSRRELLAVDQPFANHNGGQLAFGPDGFLYLALGDGGSAGDPMGNAQDLGTLLGKILRIDPRPGDGSPYRIPPGNPFAGRPGARPEIWAYGLRNPWRFSFDRGTGDLWIGDVGQNDREEIDFEPAGTGGRNYGWDRLEGTRRFEGRAPAGAVPPILEYGRDEGSTVVGGVVYRGRRIPALRGVYLYADFYRDEIRGLRQSGGRVAEQGTLGVRVEGVASFGEGADGEVYLLSFARGLLRLDP